mmetsp:Transcript_14503/g.39272  ORF Transcript_14503/g.39272 Transcript_14503/m.39272 type:complete len:217 (-) Transcript_14503:814-1464(-)
MTPTTSSKTLPSNKSITNGWSITRYKRFAARLDLAMPSKAGGSWAKPTTKAKCRVNIDAKKLPPFPHVPKGGLPIQQSSAQPEITNLAPAKMPSVRPMLTTACNAPKQKPFKEASITPCSSAYLSFAPYAWSVRPWPLKAAIVRIILMPASAMPPAEMYDSLCAFVQISVILINVAMAKAATGMTASMMSAMRQSLEKLQITPEAVHATALYSRTS